MDDLARESVPLPSLTRKRKADSEECEVTDPSASPEPSKCEPLPGKLNDPCTGAPRLSLETPQHPSQSTWYSTTAGPDNSPLSSPTPPMTSPSSPVVTSPSERPSRSKRPRVDNQGCSKVNRRTASHKRAQDLVTALQALQGSWHWATSSSGDTRLVAPIPHSTDPATAPVVDSQGTFVSSDPLASSSRIVIPIDPCSPHIPIRHPPINKETLKELDLEAIMRNPQLRSSPLP